jgi:hypothetical protein
MVMGESLWWQNTQASPHWYASQRLVPYVVAAKSRAVKTYIGVVNIVYFEICRVVIDSIEDVACNDVLALVWNPARTPLVSRVRGVR